jgi:hypothetical protein
MILMGKTRKKLPPLCLSCYLWRKCADPCHPKFCEYHHFFRHAKAHVLFDLQRLYENAIAGAFLYDLPPERDIMEVKTAVYAAFFPKPKMKVKNI